MEEDNGGGQWRTEVEDEGGGRGWQMRRWQRTRIRMVAADDDDGGGQWSTAAEDKGGGQGWRMRAANVKMAAYEDEDSGGG